MGMETMARALQDVSTSTLWAYSLAVGVIVILIVAALLLALIYAARRIDYHANEIWETGKKIAGNTVSIWMLEKTNAVAGEILNTAQSIDSRAEAVDNKIAALASALGTRR
jgi:hypothetical protein